MRSAKNRLSQMKEIRFSVKGMHCPSCELLIEKRLLEEKGVKAVEASAGKSEVVIEYLGKRPSAKVLNKIFEKDGYVFSQKLEKEEKKSRDFLTIFLVAVFLIFGFLALGKLGYSSLVRIDSRSTLPVIFIFGVIAGFSTCSALVGGIIFSLSKQWNSLYSDKDSTLRRLKPHLLFNAGRLIAFFILGMLLGLVGKSLQGFGMFSSFLMVAISVMMFFLALQMLGVKALGRFQLTMPKVLTRYIANEKNFKSRYMPFFLGALTFFLPCGFTLSAQSVALISGNPWQGGLIMFLFALGTLPALTMISFSSVKLIGKSHISGKFLKIAGVLVLFFSLYNLNSAFNVLGLVSLNDLGTNSARAGAVFNGLPEIVNGRQILRMEAKTASFEPNRLKVRAGIPVRWEIEDKGFSGCTSAIIAKSLFEGRIELLAGKTTIKEFTPEKPGIYKFSCWMGMVTGTIEAVDEKGQSGGVVESGNSTPTTGSCGCSQNR